jgi:all-trans-retinol 13,14-reductase
MKYDYVVIGAGVSGMTAAMILAKQGRHVALVEKSKKIAPVLRGFSRNNIHYDTGFHYTGGFGQRGILTALFAYLGLDTLQKEAYDPDGFDILRCLTPEFEFRFPYGYDRLRERFHETFPSDKSAVNRYFQTVEDIYNTFPYINPAFDIQSAERLKQMQQLSLQAFLDQLTDNTQLKYLLTIHCLLHGVNPDEIPLGLHIAVIGSFYESVHRIRGGGKALVNAFEQQLAKIGVDLYCGQGVKEVLFSPDKTLSGVRLADDMNIKCQGVVCTVHPHIFLEMVPDGPFRPAYKNRLNDLAETCSANMLYAACPEPVKPLSGANMFIVSNMDNPGFRESDSLENRLLCVTAARHADNESAAQGVIAISPSTQQATRSWSDSFTGKRPVDYQAYKKELAVNLQNHMETACTEFRGNMTHATCATPLTVRDYANSPFGSLYGIKHKVGQNNPIPLTRANGLYLAGQAITMPGVLGAVISGFEACSFIVGHELLRQKVNEYR